MGMNECMCKNALVVEGDHVHMYGLFCEHTIEDLVVWKGEHGCVHFYQSELPYDVPTDAYDYYSGYRVDDDVDHHIASGLGVYCNFTCADVRAPNGMEFPSKTNVVFKNPFTVFLNNRGGIVNVVQKGDTKIGDAVDKDNRISRSWIG